MLFTFGVTNNFKMHLPQKVKERFFSCFTYKHWTIKQELYLPRYNGQAEHINIRLSSKKEISRCTHFTQQRMKNTLHSYRQNRTSQSKMLKKRMYTIIWTYQDINALKMCCMLISTSCYKPQHYFTRKIIVISLSSIDFHRITEY